MSQTSGAPQAAGAAKATGPPLSQGRPIAIRRTEKARRAFPAGLHLHTCMPANLHTCYLYSLSHLSK